MKNRSKRKSQRRIILQLRALYLTITSISLAVLAAVLSLIPSIPAGFRQVLAFFLISGLAVAVYIITYLLLILDNWEKQGERAEASEEAQQQQDDMEAATRRAVTGGIVDAAQDETFRLTLKALIRDVIREESARANLADKASEIDLPEDEEDDQADTSQQST